MPDESKEYDPQAVWKNQPEETSAVALNQIVDRRTQTLYANTRSEIIVSITAALFFLAVLAWRLAPPLDALRQAGYAVILLWVLATVYRFRDRIWRRDQPHPSAVAAPGIEYYRRELERRRDHLTNEWLWHGPLLLACLLFAVSFLGKSLPSSQRMRGVLPLVLVLAVWAGLGFWRRRRQARDIQREIDEIKAL
ncbi:hypothetical protein [uncultured Paludibaculum sp.]|uniref:hypothetical protein n=1 Tax=uncultured Paludibaculum sp. TaxID=1765020 RepID=UPI002AABCDE6|nr:hypothetical protein [uncultured Paludibaculum sp.]